MRINRLLFTCITLVKRIIQFSLLLFLINNSYAQLNHPGISHSFSDLERIKAMVEAGEEPWASEYANLSSSSLASCDYQVLGDGSTELTALGEFGTDGYAAYYNALMWFITGDECHAEKAVEIFNGWTNIKRVPSTFALSNGRYVWKMCEGAEIIKHTYDGWSVADQKAFGDMLVYPGWSGTTVPTAAIESRDVSFYWNIYQGDRARYGNQGLFGFRSLMAMGIFLDNEIIYDRVLRYIQGLPHRADDLPYPAGPPNNNSNNPYNDCEFIEERNAAGFADTIEDYGYNEVMSNYIYENGQCQESSRDQVHSAVGIHIMTCIAEMAWNQGDDLYGHLENRLLKGIEFFMRYNVGATQFASYGYPDWNPTVASGEYIERYDRSGRFLSKKINPHVVCDTERYSRGQDLLDPYYELPLGHYKDRLKLPESDYQWTLAGQGIFKKEVGYETIISHNEYHGWGGFKFHRVSPGDPVSGFDVDGLPVFKMNDVTTSIEAENYDYFVLNGEGRVYHDISAANIGGEYRTDESVDLKVCSEGGYAVTGIEDGEWLTYTVAVPSTGTYDINIRYASQNAGGDIKFSFAEKDVTEFVTIPNGGVSSTGLTDWKDFKVASEVRLEKGAQQMKLMFGGTSGSFDLNNISLSLVEEEPEPVNLAILYGTATQSVDSDPCPYTGCAELAIDGNTNGSFGGGSVSHTSHGSSGSLKWWQVDLGANYRIETIDIYNRTGGYQARLSDITTEVIDSEGNVVFTEFYEGYPDPSTSISTGGVVGQVVKISKTTNTGITLAEVEVYGVDSVVTLSNEDIEFENSVQLYPNPVNSEINITNGVGARLVVYNILGVECLITRIENNHQKVNMSGLTNGVYFIKIIKNGSSFTKKIIKQ